MIDLKRFLELKGLSSFDDLVKYCGGECFDQLDRMVENKEVSVHTESMGEKKYRYPYYAVKVVGHRPSKSIKVLKLIQDNPGLNAASIKKTLKISQSAFERMEEELRESGQITRTKKGAAWIYSASGVEAKPAVKVPSGAWYLFFEHMQPDFKPLSLQQLAKNYRCSREVITEGQRWLTEQGILVGNHLEGYWSMNVEERKAWLLETFPTCGAEPWEDWNIESWTSELTKRSLYDSVRPVAGGVLQSSPLAQPDELERLILEAMKGEFEWTISMIQKAVASPLWYGMENGSTVNLGAKRVIQLAKDGLIIREWDGDDEIPALYSLPEKRV